MRDTDHNYPRLLHVAQVITMQETIDNMLLMTWDSESEPLSNLGEQSRSFLYTKSTQGKSEKEEDTYGVPDYMLLDCPKGLQG